MPRLAGRRKSVPRTCRVPATPTRAAAASAESSTTEHVVRRARLRKDDVREIIEHGVDQRNVRLPPASRRTPYGGPEPYAEQRKLHNVACQSGCTVAYRHREDSCSQKAEGHQECGACGDRNEEAHDQSRKRSLQEARAHFPDGG